MSDSKIHVPWEVPAAGGDQATLLASLERTRATFAWKCGGLDSAGLQARVGISAITIGGLLKHMALVEEHSFVGKFLDQDLGAPWNEVDWDNDPDWEWRTAADDAPEDLYATWERAVDRSRSIVDEALTKGDLDKLSPRVWPDGRSPSLRRIIIDMIEEYARHVGHADLIREAVDGRVGEDPPGDFRYGAPRNAAH